MSDVEDQPEQGLVRVMPAGIDVAVASDQSLMGAASAIGIRWPSACNGQAQCGLCAVEVLEGDLVRSPVSVREAQMLARLIHRPRSGGTMRLACQLQPKESLTVYKLNVRAPSE